MFDADSRKIDWKALDKSECSNNARSGKFEWKAIHGRMAENGGGWIFVGIKDLTEIQPVDFPPGYNMSA